MQYALNIVKKAGLELPGVAAGPSRVAMLDLRELRKLRFIWVLRVF